MSQPRRRVHITRMNLLRLTWGREPERADIDPTAPLELTTAGREALAWAQLFQQDALDERPGSHPKDGRVVQLQRD